MVRPAYHVGQAEDLLSKMSPAQKKQEQEYFGQHSFEFSSLFKSHHPGPCWILAKADEFQLLWQCLVEYRQTLDAAHRSSFDNTASLRSPP